MKIFRKLGTEEHVIILMDIYNILMGNIILIMKNVKYSLKCRASQHSHHHYFY